MDAKQFLKEVHKINELRMNPDTWSNRRQIKKLRKHLEKMIKETAQKHANKMYQQTYEFYVSLLDSNLKK